MSLIELDTLKAAHRSAWAAGDYAAVAELIDDVPRHLVDAARTAPGDAVLDVATGNGNLALHAAAAGAHVVGLDLTPELFASARRRAEALGVSVEWREGDAEAMPFPDAHFDRVFSVFGVQFAPRHEAAAAELVRVCRPGGTVALCSWTPGSAVGELFEILSRYLPPAPPFASAPPLWGSEQHVRRLFARSGIGFRFARATTAFRFASPEAFVSFFETTYGPTVKARERLAAEDRWWECRGELLRMAVRRNAAPGNGLLLPSDYLIAIGRKVG